MSTLAVNIHSKADQFAKTFLSVEVKKAAAQAPGGKKAAPGAAPAAAASTGAQAQQQSEPEDRLYLDHAEMGKVQTRFPPEASGFLHIGHAKALLINRMLADKYQGKMLFRFDDTNPAKEKHEFELAIQHDMKLLNVGFDIGPTYSSDYFDKFIELAGVMIKEGTAYCDATDVDTMRQQRFDGIPSKYRDQSVAENERMWKEMLKGSEEGQKAVLRAKIDMSADNKALRDPVLFRVNVETPHARTGTKYKAYPTYDFCCPVIDSLEGVTHALRTNEYHDRNDQYFWICDALKLRKPYIQDFSRLNMENTLMSKRKLTSMVETGVVDGWDDPRFPTVRGLLRRGMTVGALREFVKVQGMSKVVNLMEWSKLWNYNNQEIDPISPRYTAVDNDHRVVCKVANFAECGCVLGKALTRLRHKKNPDLGEKSYFQTPTVFLDSEDVLLLQEGEEVTLMDWGNAFVKNIVKDETGKDCVSATLELNPTGDVKKTKYKLTWVPDLTENIVPVAAPAAASSATGSQQQSQQKLPVCNVKLLVKEFDHLLTKKKPEEGDDIDALMNKYTLFTANLLGEAALAEVKQGQFIQLERRGFYICDKVDDETGLIILHSVPDGRDKLNHLSAKAAWIKANPTLAASLPGAQAAKPAAKPSGKAAAAAAASSGAAAGGGSSDAAQSLEQKRAEKAAKKAAQKQPQA